MINLNHDLQDNHKHIEIALERYLLTVSNQQSSLVQAMRYSILGGKRLRSFLVYQTGKLFGLTSASLDAPAAAVEYVHAYSLIHDDLPVMDNDSLRRGQPTCHIKFGEAIAILAGNALQTLAFNVLAEEMMPTVPVKNRLKMISTLASASGANGMCLGQSFDLDTENYNISSLQKIEIIYKHKTAALIRAAVHMGGLAAGKIDKYDYQILNLLDKFALTLGLAFQAQDDIFDIAKDNKITNKSKKNTYPSILGLQQTKIKIDNLYHESLKSLKLIDALGYDTTNLVRLVYHFINYNE